MLGIIVAIAIFYITYIVIKFTSQKENAKLEEMVNQRKAKEIVNENNRIQLCRDKVIFTRLGHEIKMFTAIVELHPYSNSKSDDKYSFPYLWRQIYLLTVDKYPRSVKGIVVKVDIRHSQAVRSSINQSVSIDFTNTELATQFMTLSKFEREQEKIGIMYQIDKLSKDNYKLSVASFNYKRKIFLWNSYFSVMPDKLFIDMNLKEIQNIVEHILTLSGYRVFNKETLPHQPVDMIAISNNKTYISIQFKKYLNNTVYSLIQELSIDKTQYADIQSWVVSNSSFNSNDEFEAMVNDIRLINWESLAKMCIGKLAIKNELPKFNEEKFREIESFLNKEFKYSDHNLLEIDSPLDSQIEHNKNQLIHLHQKKMNIENFDIEEHL